MTTVPSVSMSWASSALPGDNVIALTAFRVNSAWLIVARAAAGWFVR
ncbi:MAG: hypothetical protein M3468_10440 [Acidobacteriota bacterium]|nr:hypothetical protein [Acidobacteriota bacterium]